MQRSQPTSRAGAGLSDGQPDASPPDLAPPTSPDLPSLLYRGMMQALDEGILVQDVSGRIIDANPAAAELLGVQHAQLLANAVGSPTALFSRDGSVLAEHRRPGRRAIDSGLPQRHTTLGFDRSDGERRWLEVATVPIMHGEGRPAFVLSTLRDVTESIVLAHEMSYQADLLDTVGDAVIGTDADHRIIFWNRAAEHLFGYAPAEVVGRHIDLLEAADPRGDRADLESVTIYGECGGVQQVEAIRTRKDGSKVHIAMTLSPTCAEDGTFLGGTSVARDITDRILAAEESERQAQRAAAAERATRQEVMNRELAERSNQAKSEFLSRMSHELRTPLNAVIGFSQILQAAKTMTDSEVDAVDHILRAGRHLLELINELLDVSRIEADQLTLSIEPVDLRDVLRSAIDLIGPSARSRLVTIELEVDGPSTALADRQRVLQVALHLLSNAVKYNHEGGLVQVHVSTIDGSRLRVGVRDSGTGIASGDVERLFTPFDRLDAEQRGIEGTGVGLALSKGLVELMGGSMGLMTEPVPGSTFWFELPAAEERLLGEASIATGSDSRPLPTPIVVLYIEDNPASRILVETMLTTHHEGVTALSAGRGRLGLEMARHHRPDLILLDRHLPEMDGAEILAAIRADDELRETVVTVISADANPAQIEHMLALGADHYLTKPFDLSDLSAIVDAVASAPSPQPSKKGPSP